MKKFLFLFTLCMTLFLCSSIDAKALTTDDADFMLEYDVTKYGWQESWFKLAAGDCRVYSVYFENEKSFTVFSPDAGAKAYFQGYTSSALPMDLVSSYNLVKWNLANCKYDVYGVSPQSHSGYPLISQNCDFTFATQNDFYVELASYDSFDSFYNKNTSSGNDDSKLPMLHYKLSSKNVISFPNIIDKKLSIDWDFSSLEPYASNPMDYAIEIIISANFYPNSEGQRICWNASNSAINQSCKRVLSGERSLLEKPYTFIYLREGDALYSASNHIFATDELQDGYYLYLRTYSKDGTKSSNYKVYKCTTGGTSGQMDLTYDTDGKEYPLDDADRDEDSDYSNEYDEDSSSSADEDPTGDSYDGNGGFTFDTLYGNLTSMVNMLQGVPELWMHVMSWLPSWFPTFIVTMMGLLIVIGVLKYIF